MIHINASFIILTYKLADTAKVIKHIMITVVILKSKAPTTMYSTLQRIVEVEHAIVMKIIIQ